MEPPPPHAAMRSREAKEELAIKVLEAEMAKNEAETIAWQKVAECADRVGKACSDISLVLGKLIFMQSDLSNLVAKTD